MRDETSGDCWITDGDAVVVDLGALVTAEPVEFLVDFVWPSAATAVTAISPAILIVCSVRITNLMGAILTSLESDPHTESISSVACVSEISQPELSLKSQ